MTDEDQIVADALRLAGVLGPGKVPNEADLQHGRILLGVVLNAWGEIPCAATFGQLPPAYRHMLVFTLADRLASEFGIRSPQLSMEALEAGRRWQEASQAEPRPYLEYKPKPQLIISPAMRTVLGQMSTEIGTALLRYLAEHPQESKAIMMATTIANPEQWEPCLKLATEQLGAIYGELQEAEMTKMEILLMLLDAKAIYMEQLQHLRHAA